MTGPTTARLAFTLAAVFAAGAAVGDEPASTPRREIPKEKRTTLRLYLTAKEAYEKWKADPKKVKVLDVRTPEEYVFVGHAEMAWNIPLALQTYQWVAGKKELAVRPNAEFVTRVKEWAKPGDTILVMCRSGGRSAMAVNALAEAGFTNVHNIVDGMEGDTVEDPDSAFFGKRMKNGWKNAGLPWTYDLEPEQMRLPKP
ncbi:rhodanese-like domain-containing protein [Urbifossiella limnaea]|uniref:Molybdopterin biosynthesis protein MoeB n=1 Tax=Urbifossiella limnaea TaxID=2528023 RepID=A0A517XT59_9BACT|nr:rhodanese-like domain-containing protein [Urbifossiella limnaea]QDU20664.1 molybdopterin biosynthesis protein MoeB [Urbifossiella limnaea]